MLSSGLVNLQDNGAAQTPRPAARQLQRVASKPVTQIPSSNLVLQRRPQFFYGLLLVFRPGYRIELRLEKLGSQRLLGSLIVRWQTAYSGS